MDCHGPMGMTGSTRYGTVIRKMSTNAKSDPDTEDYGAFSYSTMQETARTTDVVAPTGIASYAGWTEAISGSGKTYSGTMELQVRFAAELVSGVVSNLMDADGAYWKHNFADVDRIVLTDAKLRRNGTWVNNSGATGTVFYTRDSGLLRPVNGQANTFQGRLLGRGADAGSEANGTWSIGDATSTGYLAGGFGVRHVGDTARPLPSGDDGSTSNSALFTMVADADATPPHGTTAKIANGMLEVKARQYGYTGRSGDTDPTYQALTDDKGTTDTADDTNIQITAKFDLAALAESGSMTVNGPKWVDGVIAVLTAQREQLAILKGLGERTATTRTAEAAAWQKVVDAVQYNVFNGLLPEKLGGDYATSSTLQADALDHIDRMLDALSSGGKLEAALDPDGTGIFNQYWIDANTDSVKDADELHDFRYYDAAQRRNEVVDDNDPTDTATVAGRTAGNIVGEREHKVIAALGTTEFTRFGIWRRESFRSARRNGAGQTLRNHSGPGTFAYSPLAPTRVGTLANLGFPNGGSARYVGETIALQNTTVLTGTVEALVSFDTVTVVTGLLGRLQITISGLANAAGDPLSQGGSDTSAGNEIADIVSGNFRFLAGAGDYAGQMILTGDVEDGTPDELTTASIATRYRRAGVGADIPAAAESFSAAALFVGQGVDGPLGVIGRWSLNDATVGRLAPDGSHTDDVGARIWGAFGAEVP